MEGDTALVREGWSWVGFKDRGGENINRFFPKWSKEKYRDIYRRRRRSFKENKRKDDYFYVVDTM